MAKTELPTLPPLPTASEIREGHELLRTYLSRYQFLGRMEPVLPVLASLAETTERYQRAAAEAEARVDALNHQEAEAKAAHERARQQMKQDLETEVTELRGEVAALTNEREVLKGEL